MIEQLRKTFPRNGQRLKGFTQETGLDSGQLHRLVRDQRAGTIPKLGLQLTLAKLIRHPPLEEH